MVKYKKYGINDRRMKGGAEMIMTREEKEEALKWFKDRKKMNLDDKCQQAENMAIKALEQEPCEDAVSRQAVKEQMIYYGFHAPDMTVTEFVEDCLPSVNPQKPNAGHWIKYGKLYQCSECKELSCCQGKFCNECGAKMVEPQESEE